MILIWPAMVFLVSVAVIIPVICTAMTLVPEMFVLFFTTHGACHQQKTKPD